MKDFYVYVYMDTRKMGAFIYGKYTFEHEPIYVGKGINGRYNAHLMESCNNNKHFKNKINAIRRSTGLDPKIIFEYEGLEEVESLELEGND